MDFFNSLHNASLFCPHGGPKSCRRAAQTPADTGFLQAFDPTRGGSRAPLRLCDSRPLLGRQSRRFLETGSLFPPLAALRQFPLRTPPAKKDSFPSDRVFRQPESRPNGPALSFMHSFLHFLLVILYGLSLCSCMNICYFHKSLNIGWFLANIYSLFSG